MILPKKLADEIKKNHSQLDEQGELFSQAQLDRYCDNFRERFSPEVLNKIDGESLLEALYDLSTKDSLVYWLEFKNDEEFPTVKFGSIAGGSALKYGIYKRKETGSWMTGAPTSQQELTIDEAVEIARKQREQLTNGIKILKRFPDKASDEEYRKLQDKMDQEAPDVSNTAWGHKYFSLFFPHKLDDYHSADYQRFHLIKLLQLPPEKEGRYICAGRYVAIANELKVLIPNFTRELSDMNERPHRYWRVGTKLGGEDSIWDLMVQKDCVAVGWPEIPDLSNLKYSKSDKEELRSLISGRYSKSSVSVGKSTQQLFNFVTAFSEGDLVVPSDGEKILGIGKVKGDYFYGAGSDAPHRRPVEWLSFEEWKIPEREGLRTTVSEIKKFVNLVGIETKLFETPGPPEKPPPEPGTEKPIPIPPLSGTLGRIKSILDRKSQVIIYGPPGTGKTYWAEKAACELAAYNKFGESYENLSEGNRKKIYGESRESQSLVRTCTFHPAYGYEDFIEGYRPKTVNDQLVFELTDGVFKKMCLDAAENPTLMYILIIDEINRGDIPRIFGELLTIIEKDKRGKTLTLAISGESFSVPGNINIIGTMNTADRSIALLDTALKRRFGFIELMPDVSVLGDTVIEKSIPLGLWLDTLNARICEFIGRDARNLQIGHAYFLENGRPVEKLSKLTRILQDEIIPLIEEYCYEDYETIAKILGKNLIDENKQRVRAELFDPARQDELIQALKSIDLDLDSSAPVIQSEAETPEEEAIDESEEDSEETKQED